MTRPHSSVTACWSAAIPEQCPGSAMKCPRQLSCSCSTAHVFLGCSCDCCSLWVPGRLSGCRPCGAMPPTFLFSQLVGSDRMHGLHLMSTETCRCQAPFLNPLACLPALPACLPVCLPACLPACLTLRRLLYWLKPASGNFAPLCFRPSHELSCHATPQADVMLGTQLTETRLHVHVHSHIIP